MALLAYRLGVMLRESGQALDRLGCQMQGKGSYAEQGTQLAPSAESPLQHFLATQFLAQCPDTTNH